MPFTRLGSAETRNSLPTQPVNAGRTKKKFCPRAKIKEQRTFVRCSRLVPSPRYFAKTKPRLLQGRGGRSARSGDRAGRRTDNRIFKRAEVADASLVRSQRRSDDAVGRHNATHGCAAADRQSKHIAALGAGRKNAVNEATAAGGRNASRTGRATQVRQRRREAQVRIRGVVRNFSSVDAADGAYGRRLVG